MARQCVYCTTIENNLDEEKDKDLFEHYSKFCLLISQSGMDLDVPLKVGEKYTITVEREV